jgi:hypothetical protein
LPYSLRNNEEEGNKEITFSDRHLEPGQKTKETPKCHACEDDLDDVALDVCVSFLVVLADGLPLCMLFILIQYLFIQKTKVFCCSGEIIQGLLITCAPLAQQLSPEDPKWKRKSTKIYHFR